MTRSPDIKGKSPAIQELGFEVLDAVIKGTLEPKDAQNLFSGKASTSSNITRTNYRNAFRQSLGPDDPIIAAHNQMVLASKGEKIVRSNIIYAIGEDEKHVSSKNAAISAAQKRSWASGRRKQKKSR